MTKTGVFHRLWILNVFEFTIFSLWGAFHLCAPVPGTSCHVPAYNSPTRTRLEHTSWKVESPRWINSRDWGSALSRERVSHSQALVLWDLFQYAIHIWMTAKKRKKRENEIPHSNTINNLLVITHGNMSQQNVVFWWLWAVRLQVVHIPLVLRWALSQLQRFPLEALPKGRSSIHRSPPFPGS